MAWSIEGVKPTYSCNKELLKNFREQLGWTQAKLARVAGYSERLVSKAESGKTISSETIANLAEALSTENCPVYPEDLVSDPLQCAQQYIAAMYEHHREMFPVIRPILDEEVVFRVAGDPEYIPFAGVYRGFAEVEKLIKLFFSVVEVPEGHDHRPHYRYIVQGNSVVVWGESWIHPIGAPLEIPMPVTLLIQFRRGKIVHCDDRFDTQTGAHLIANS